MNTEVATHAAATSSPPLPIGCQVWPMRSILNDFPSFVAMAAGIGVTRLELCSPIGFGHEFASLADGKEVRRILADHGMKAESGTSAWASCGTAMRGASRGRKKSVSRR